MSLSRDWRRYGMLRVAGCSAICRKASSSRSVSFGGRIWSILQICACGSHDQAGFVRPDDDSEGVARSFLGHGKGGFSSSDRSLVLDHAPLQKLACEHVSPRWGIVKSASPQTEPAPAILSNPRQGHPLVTSTGAVAGTFATWRNISCKSAGKPA